MTEIEEYFPKIVMLVGMEDVPEEKRLGWVIDEEPGVVIVNEYALSQVKPRKVIWIKNILNSLVKFVFSRRGSDD